MELAASWTDGETTLGLCHDNSPPWVIHPGGVFVQIGLHFGMSLFDEPEHGRLAAASGL